MTVTDQIEILDDKIKSNQAQYHLGREAGKISALSSRDLLQKYEYLTGKDLGHKPSVFEKVKFEYSPLGMTLNKTIKPADNTKKLVESDGGLRYGSYSFVEFKSNTEKLKKTPSLDSKNKEIKRFLEKLNKFKKSPLLYESLKIKMKRILFKKTPKKFTITTMFTKNITIRKKIN